VNAQGRSDAELEAAVFRTGVFRTMNRWPTCCVAELIGTFAVVFAGTGAIVVNDVSGGQITHVGVAITFGLVVMAMIYAVGDVSGAHLNPAVTCGFWLAKRLSGRVVVPYIASQIVGALMASVLLRLLFPHHPTLGVTVPAGEVPHPVFQSFVLEAVLTAILMFVILSVALGAKEKGLMAGIAIGGVVGLEAMFAGPICGASMNPARSLAPAIVTGTMAHQWLYVIAPIIGAAVAVMFWKLVHAPAEMDIVHEEMAE
jgi:aquaporin NIP